MKQPFLIIAFLSILFTAKSQVLFNYGNHQVTKTEFLNAYNKNKEAGTAQDNSLKDYLQLYIAYKLKVQAAKDLKMDTLPAFKADISNFKNQVESNYLVDRKKMDALEMEAFDRSQKDIHVISYFFDTTSVSSANMQSAMALLKNSKKNELDEIVDRLSSSGMKISKNDLGFITVFTLPYTIESNIYKLNPGELSAPYHTGKGFYIFKNENQQPAAGKIKVAQILISTELQDGAASKRIADSIYNLLVSGADFGSLATQLSFDTKSARDSGILEEFSVGKYDPIFEKEAFSLKKDNEISKPFQTTYGFHILKRISATPVPSSKDDQGLMYDLRNKILNDKGRMAEEKKLFFPVIYKKTGFAKRNVSEENIWILTDSSLMENTKVTSGNVNDKTILFTFNDRSSNNVGDWVDYVRKTEKAVPGRLHESYKKLMPDFIDSCVKENYRERLSDLDPAFKQQINQFTEENLLFEVMNTKIWNKASADSVALKNYYDAHKTKYISESGAPINNFEDARGLVVADYQEYLEEKWLNELKKKYPVVINQKVFESLKK